MVIVWSGAGCGLTSLSLRAAGYDVIATDKLALLDLLRHNVSSGSSGDSNTSNTSSISNSTSSNSTTSSNSIEVRELDWYASSTTAAGLLLEGRPPVDVIVCSDCLYSSDSVLRLLDVLTGLASPHTVVVLCNEMRTAFDEFTYLAGQHSEYSMSFREIPLIEPDLELFRGPLTGRVASPPLRLCLMQIVKK